MQIADIVAPDDGVRHRIDRAINDNEVCDVNPFGVVATIAAYNESGEWLDALCHYLYANYRCVCDFFAEHLPQYTIVPLEGTYLVWIDCSASGMDGDEVVRRLMEEQHLLLNAGSMYGEGGEMFVRLNIACPRALLTEALHRMSRVLGR